MHESADTSARPGEPEAPLATWASALLGETAMPLACAPGSASWTGRIADTPAVLIVEAGEHADPAPASRAVDYATRTGTPLITALIDGGGSLSGSLLHDVHLLSGVVPHLAIESGERTPAGRIRAAAADFSTAVTIEREVDDPHVSADADAAEWVRAILTRLPANRTVAAPHRPPVRDQASAHLSALSGAEDPLAVIDAISDSVATPVSAGSSALRCSFSSLDGHTIGTIATTSFSGDGSVTAADLRRTARFVTFCDAFRLPVVFALDTPGLAPGTDASAINPLARALSEAATPLVALVTDRLGRPLTDLFSTPALVPELLTWGALETVTATGARAISPAQSAHELLTVLERWGGVDAPLPARRCAVAPR